MLLVAACCCMSSIRLTVPELLRSVSHEGDLERLRCFGEKLLRNNSHVRVGVVGGSVSAGSNSGNVHDPSWLFHRQMQRWLQRRFPNAKVSHFNAAIPAVPPYYLEHCLELHVPQDADLVFLEAAANLCGQGSCAKGMASIERLLRRLLEFPSRPAVIFVHTFAFYPRQVYKNGKPKVILPWYPAPGLNDMVGKRAARRRHRPHAVDRPPVMDSPTRAWLAESDLRFAFHTSAFGEPQPEHLLEELSKYYMLPSVSLRDVIFHAMKANTTFHGHGLTDLYYDRLHPSHHGHTILAQSLQFLLSRAATLPAQAHAWQHEEIAADEASSAGLALYDRTSTSSSWPGGQAGRQAGRDRRAGLGAGLSRFVRMPTQQQRDESSPSPHQSSTSCAGLSPTLPPPMQEGILEAHMECHDAESMHFLGMVDRQRCHGWSYTVERSRWTGAPKPGIIATAAGAQCTFTYALDVPPRTPKTGGASSASSAAMPHSSIHRVGVGFLRSYERMGRIALRCVYDCACSPITIDGWWKLSFSPLEVQYISVAIRPQGGAEEHGRCGLEMTVLNDTSSGQHKFKVAALFINRQVNGTDFIGKYILTTAMEQKGRAAVAGRLEEQAASRRRGRLWGTALHSPVMSPVRPVRPARPSRSKMKMKQDARHGI